VGGDSTSCIKVRDQTVQKRLPGLDVRNHPATQCHIPEEKNPWQYRCKKPQIMQKYVTSRTKTNKHFKQNNVAPLKKRML
jgi:ribosomal protein S18